MDSGTLTSSGTASWYIGNAGTGVFTQTGGLVSMAREMDIGAASTGNGTYTINSNTGASTLATATGNAYGFVIGDQGTGVVNQSGNSTVNAYYLNVGNTSTGNGTYNLSGGTLGANAGSIQTWYIGNSGTGSFTQTSGTVTVPRILDLGETATTGNGTYTISGGTLSTGGGNSSYAMNVGDNGTGSLTASGTASVTAGSLILGNNTGSTGSGSLSGTATLTINGNGKNLTVGNSGSGTLTLAGNTVYISDSGTTTTVRSTSGVSGAMSGYGTFTVGGNTGTLINNGTITANGGILDLTGFTGGTHISQAITNTIANVTTNGWYAKNGGQLKLAPIYTGGGTQYFWGGTPAGGASSLQWLVNSVEVNFSTAPVGSTFANFSMSLLDPAAAAAPPVSGLAGDTVIGLWSWQKDQFGNTPTLQFEYRYDAVAAGGETPALYGYNGSSWTSIGDTVDSADSLLTSASGIGLTQYQDFAIVVSGVPEPATLGMLCFTGVGLLGRRRRRAEDAALVSKASWSMDAFECSGRLFAFLESKDHAVAVASMMIEIISAHPGNVFIDGRAIVFQIAAPPAARKLGWRVADGWGAVVAGRPRCAGNGRLTLSGLGPGWFQLQIQDKSGEAISTCFTIVAPYDLAKIKQSPFGVMATSPRDGTPT